MAQNQIQNNPYGAWELKTTYQRNMLLSIMLVTTAILGLVLLAQLSGLHDKPVLPAVEIIEKIGIVKLWERPPKLETQRPPIGGNNKPAAQNELKPLVIPKPVADTMIFENDELAVIASQEEISDMIDRKGTETGTGTGTGASTIDDGLPPEDYCYTCLDPDSFIPLEIYPEMISEQLPVYPEIARKFGFEGSVWLQVLIDKKGKVMKAEIAKTSEIEMLDDAALTAAWHNRFSPGIQSGRPVIVWVKYKVDFVLRE